MSKTNNKEQNNIVMLYGALWATIILLLIPKMAFAIVGSILLIILLIVSYIIKKKSSNDSLSHNHTSFIIRTIWFGAFILPVITITIAIIYLMPNYDPYAMSPCGIELAEYLSTHPADTSMNTLYGYIYPCMEGFMRDNGNVFLTSGLIAALPVLIYLVYRLLKGTIFSLKNKLITKPKSWII